MGKLIQIMKATTNALTTRLSLNQSEQNTSNDWMRQEFHFWGLGFDEWRWKSVGKVLENANGNRNHGRNQSTVTEPLQTIMVYTNVLPPSLPPPLIQLVIITQSSSSWELSALWFASVGGRAKFVPIVDGKSETISVNASSRHHPPPTRCHCWTFFDQSKEVVSENSPRAICRHWKIGENPQTTRCLRLIKKQFAWKSAELKDYGDDHVSDGGEWRIKKSGKEYHKEIKYKLKSSQKQNVSNCRAKKKWQNLENFTIIKFYDLLQETPIQWV